MELGEKWVMVRVRMLFAPSRMNWITMSWAHICRTST